MNDKFVFNVNKDIYQIIIINVNHLIYNKIKIAIKDDYYKIFNVLNVLVNIYYKIMNVYKEKISQKDVYFKIQINVVFVLLIIIWILINNVYMRNNYL